MGLAHKIVFHFLFGHVIFEIDHIAESPPTGLGTGKGHGWHETSKACITGVGANGADFLFKKSLSPFRSQGIFKANIGLVDRI